VATGLADKLSRCDRFREIGGSQPGGQGRTVQHLPPDTGAAPHLPGLPIYTISNTSNGPFGL
jgi:hypothetical protein